MAEPVRSWRLTQANTHLHTREVVRSETLPQDVLDAMATIAGRVEAAERALVEMAGQVSELNIRAIRAEQSYADLNTRLLSLEEAMRAGVEASRRAREVA